MNRLFFDIGNDLSVIYYYFQKTDLIIKSELVSVEHSTEEIYIKFTGGGLSIWRDSIVLKVKKPNKTVGEFEFCYLIKNCDGEILGYIGKPCEK